ncbi:uncharacterized protein LOC111282653 [Durio zibethinus]|uniref:Uncharacterized protein LOC111282653 n=1 Tax=Durio zibethinus TaxID=66656 RepID=A0A6P5XFV1_DURZI|nr:uncharacterized protein LOC111282653 [Durio zibethinus]
MCKTRHRSTIHMFWIYYTTRKSCGSSLLNSGLMGFYSFRNRICPKRVKRLYLQAVMLLDISNCNLLHIDLSVNGFKRLLTAEVLVVILSVLKALNCRVGYGCILLQSNAQIIGLKAYVYDKK